eukprot:4220704-Pleurochrysis_carterae.AAC.1
MLRCLAITTDSSSYIHRYAYARRALLAAFRCKPARFPTCSLVSQTGFQAELAYAIGLCYYQQRQYGPALKHIAEIIERGVREHPELS